MSDEKKMEGSPLCTSDLPRDQLWKLNTKACLARLNNKYSHGCTECGVLALNRVQYIIMFCWPILTSF